MSWKYRWRIFVAPPEGHLPNLRGVVPVGVSSGHARWRCRRRMKRLDILLERFVRRAPHGLGGDDLKTPVMRVLSIRYRELLE